MPSGTIEIEKNKQTKFKGYVTAPAYGVHPGILLLHQEYGVDANIRAVAEHFAANNYTVFVPDIFWRTMPGCELSSFSDNDVLKANTIKKQFNADESLDDITSCLKWLRETPQCNGLVSTVGFGIGSNLSYLCGLWLDIESTVCYDFHGSSFFKNNDTYIRRPMLIHLSTDIYKEIIKDKKNQYIEKMQNINLNVYDNCNRNFFRISDKSYNEAIASEANKLTLTHIKNSFAKPHST